jgi:uncharacterized membrane-anchored protein YhcB (DUF1043 family)
VIARLLAWALVALVFLAYVIVRVLRVLESRELDGSPALDRRFADHKRELDEQGQQLYRSSR